MQHTPYIYKYLNTLPCKKAFFFVLGAMMVLLASGSARIDSHNQANGSGEGISQQTPVTVGEVVPYTDEGREGNNSQIITYPGASFIKVHFLSLDLLPGDTVTVSDPTGAEKYTYPGSDSTSDGGPGFWSMSITGETALVQLHSQSSSKQLSASGLSNSGFTIDKYGRGYPQDEIESILARSTCGVNQRTDVVCYQGTNPAEFDKSNAVGRLLIYIDGFYSLCTTWRVGPGASMLTNHHCLASQAEVAGSETWFNYQNQTCGTPSMGTITKVTGDKLLTTDYALDFTLFTVNNPESIADFGYLEIEARAPVLGEQIYIPQHGAGNPKEFGVENDLNEGNLCRIDAAVATGYENGTDTGYYCDTTGGSSGSPVLASSSNKVIAIHHFGTFPSPGCTTPNQGVRMDLIWPRVEPYLLQVSPAGSIGSYTPRYTWNESSTATWYYLWVNGPNGNVIKQWYAAPAICNAGSCSVTPSITLGGGNHTWWIRTWNSSGHGPWSSGMDFSLPVIPTPGGTTLISPSGVTDPTPVYTWDEVPGATQYYLWVKRPSGDPLKIWYQASAVCSGGMCSAEPATSLGRGTHTWWIRTWNSAGYGPWSAGMNFTITVPAMATLVSPSGAITDTTPTYTWNAVEGVTHYYLWVNGPSGNVIKTWYTSAEAGCSGGGSCSVTPASTLGNGAHTWWIRTWNTIGNGPWSSAGNFSVSP